MSNRDWSESAWRREPPVFADEAMDEWTAMVRRRCPWNEMFPDDLSGEFRAVLEELLQPDEPSTERRASRLRHVAREHGAFRRRQGCQAMILAEEIAVADDAIAMAVVRGGGSPAVIATIQDSLAPVMRAIKRAMYSGYVDSYEPPDLAL